MSRTLFLHCGPAKTGTSAIQAVLRDATPPGVFYPVTGQWPDGAHHKLLFAMRGMTNRGSIDIPPFETLMADLCRELDNAETDVVISSEAFNIKDIETFLGQLKARLTRPFDDIRAIVVLRHPLERAASVYNQNTKDMAVTDVQIPKDYLETHGPNLCLMPLVRIWQGCAVPVTFLNYHPSDTLISRFFEAIGHLPQDAALPNQTHNRSINGYGLLSLLAGRMVDLSQQELTGLFRDLRNDTHHSIWKGPSFPFARNTCLTFLETVVAPDLAEVEQQTGLTFPDLSTDVPKRFQLSTDDLATIRARIMTHSLADEKVKVLDTLLAAFAMRNRTPPAQN